MASNVDVVVRARDEASKKFATIGHSALNMGSLIKRAVLIAGTYLGAQAIKNFTMSTVKEYAAQEEAAYNLYAALSNLGKGGQIEGMEEFAEQMQKQTIYADDTILAVMKLGATLGRLSGEQLQGATKAAIGLAAAYNIDLESAMRLVALGATGVAARLRQIGIEVNKNKSEQDIWNEIQEKGIEGFKIAEVQTKTYSGTVIQMRNAIKDVKKEIGESLMPIFKTSAERIKEWAENNRERIGTWADHAVNAALLVKDVFGDFISFMKSDWLGGLSWVFDSFLIMMQAAFESAVRLAFAGGMAMYQGVIKGWGSRVSIGELQRKKFTEMGGEIYSREQWAKLMLGEEWGDMAAIQARKKALEGQYAEMAGGERIRRGQEELYAKARQEAMKGYQESNTAAIVKGLWDGVGTAFKEAFDDIIKVMPGGLKEKMQKSYDDYLARLGKLGEKAPYPVLPPGGDLGTQLADAVKGIKSRWSMLESSFLTMAPGSRLDPAVQTAKNTEKAIGQRDKQIAALNKIRDKIAAGFAPPVNIMVTSIT